jgi:hypothetical protein
LIFSPKVGEKVKISVEFRGEWENLVVVVIGRTGLVSTKVVPTTTEIKDKKKVTVELPVTNLMVPSAHVIVYYIHELGEIVYDRIKLDFEGKYPNQVSKEKSFSIAKTVDHPNHIVGLENFKKTNGSRLKSLHRLHNFAEFFRSSSRRRPICDSTWQWE